MKLAGTSLAAVSIAALLTLGFDSALGEDRKLVQSEFFEAHIRPVLMEACFTCHGGEKANHGLRVDSRAALLKGGESGPAIVPGQPEKSLVIQVMRQKHGGVKMEKQLPDDTIANFVRWVSDGAVWPDQQPAKTGLSSNTRHWAFAPVQDATPPQAGTDWSEHPIDQFIYAKLRERKLAPVRKATRQTLIRRVYFDLLGLPPTPEEVDQVVQDKSDRAWEQLIEGLLASPRYGERWGRHWLDVVRYADTAGDNADYPVPEARLYRDYVIDAFNADKPYDAFVQEQLAGDILAREGPREKYAERVIATTFLALSRRFATAPFELMHLTIEDTIETTGRAFMGLTLRCARCHDHKYDPISREDYYGLYGLFESTRYPYAGSEEFQSKNFDRSGFIPLLPSGEAEPQINTWKERVARLEAELKRTEEASEAGKRLAALKSEIEARTKAIKAAEEQGISTDVTTKEVAGLKQERDKVEGELKKELAPLRDGLKKLKRLGLPSELPCAYAVADANPIDSCLQVRGEPAEKGPIIKRGVPKFLCNFGDLDIPDGASGRLEFARWLTSPRHPLTSRVIVNRIWQHHFGKGIVATPSNLGLRGELPTHPELLDYLATRFVESGWSIKAMHRLILTSRTYQLASDWNEVNAQEDESNRYCWRFDRRRLDAEAIRDSMMRLAGTLDLRQPGPHPFPSIEKWNWTQHSPFKAVYESNHRGVYLMTQRIQRHPYLSLFDAPDANTPTEVRTAATVPLQALYLMNNPFVQQQASAFARRLIAARSSDEQRVQRAMELAYSRRPTVAETQKAIEYLRLHRAESAAAGTPEEKVEDEAWTSYARVLLTGNEFIYVD